MKKTYIGAFAIAFAAFLWALDGVILTPWILELGMYDVPIFVFMLHLFGSVFLSYFYFKRKGEFKNLNKKDWFAFGLVGLFGGALGTMAIVGAIIMVYSNGLNISVVLLLQKLQPIFAILLALIILKERPRPQFYFWAFLALVGSYFLIFGFGKPDLNAGGMLVPALLALLAAFSFGSSTVFSKFAVTKISHQVGTMLRFFVTTVIMAVIIFLVSVLNYTGFHTPYLGFAGFGLITWRLLGAFLVTSLVVGIPGIFIYYYGLKRVMASRSTMYELAFPISSILLEWIFNDRILSIGQWIGAAVMVAAMLFIVHLKRTSEI